MVRRLLPKLFAIPSSWRRQLYVHIPFCAKRCHFCVYLSKTAGSRLEVDEFVNAELPRQLEECSSAFDLPFDEVYFGGGTPTFLSAAQLANIWRCIPDFDGIRLKAIEVSPATVNDDHLALLAQHRFSYVSMGVQTFNEAVLRSENRERASLYRMRTVIQQLEEARVLTNVDLIFFLRTGGVEDLADAATDLSCVMSKMYPSSVTVHSNYNAPKSLPKQIGMMRAIKAALAEHPEYACTNSLLEEGGAAYDLAHAAEYRLMRRDHAFDFRYCPSVPQAVRYGYNMLAVGYHDGMVPRSNFGYVTDAYPPSSFLSVLEAARICESSFNAVRRHLGLTVRSMEDLETFFRTADDERRFLDLLRAANAGDTTSSLFDRKRAAVYTKELMK